MVWKKGCTLEKKLDELKVLERNFSTFFILKAIYLNPVEGVVLSLRIQVVHLRGFQLPF